jgi:hybrid cluster-associated redox disulfide protein
MEATKKKVTKDTVIGDVIKDNPAATKVIERYFGNGCFTCPGIKVESIAFGAMMHNVDPEKIVKEINELSERLVEEGN